MYRDVAIQSGDFIRRKLLNSNGQVVGAAEARNCTITDNSARTWWTGVFIEGASVLGNSTGNATWTTASVFPYLEAAANSISCIQGESVGLGRDSCVGR
jgi:hypothetical protein